MKCNDCLSEKSWEECKNITKHRLCDPVKKQTRCVVADGEFRKGVDKKGFFARSCSTEEECVKFEKDGNLAPPCADKKKEKWSVECHVKCCAGDACNKDLKPRHHGGAIKLVSGLLVLSCASLSMIAAMLF